ncbi:MAG: SH3 domain-containing protein [Elusimicrobiales bacterium]|nr:SH3 domain-containing protein [Elusimicrobiales bacterium]
MNFKIIFLSLVLFPAQVMAENILSVSPQRANIRSGPGAEYEVVWEAAKYYPLEVVDRDGNWLKISDYANDEGWIHRSLLSGVPTVVVTSQKANVRTGPGMEYEVSWVLDEEYSLKLLEAEGDWLKVSDGGEVSGWIHRTVAWGFSEPPSIEKSPAY